MRNVKSYGWWLLGAVFGIVLWLPQGASTSVQVLDENQAPGRALAQQATRGKEVWITADHALHPALKKDFKAGPEVTESCLSCHELAAGQFQKTIHWTWRAPDLDPAQKVGKGGLSMNNFCINIQSNEPRCTSCHAGYGWKDKNFDFSNAHAVDCLVCHEQTGTYHKFPTGAGNPVAEPTLFKEDGKTYNPPEWNKVAQSVGRPSRQNCGTCHFSGGGGDGVKHGDMDSSLMKPNKELDVHMGVDGQNFDCVRCHSTKVHRIAGRMYTIPASKERKSLLQDDLAPKIMCESCHSSKPHKAGVKANDHTDKVACQSCHIPTFARVNPTTMWWDWSKAGRKKDDQPYKELDELGKPKYDTKKGEFRWAKNVAPEYFWFNGSVNSLTATDVIDPAGVVAVGWPEGSMEDNHARIFPFKIHRGKQPYDKVNKTLVIPRLFGKEGTGAYWAEYDWDKAAAAGMQYAGVPYSGEMGFVETTYAFPITHMVAPKNKALQCQECHADNGRLQNLKGFYMPGRDSTRAVKVIGWTVVLGSLLGVLFHGVGRFIVRVRKEGKP